MHNYFKRFLALVLLACFPLVFSACGGGGGGGVGFVEMTSVSGTTAKGPIKGALVQVFKLKSDGTKSGQLGRGVSRNDGSYTIRIPKARAVAPLVVTVTGRADATYLSESTGGDVAFTSADSFNAVIDTFDASKKYTVSPLTEAAYQQLQQFLTDNPSSTADTRIVSAVNARIASLFNVTDILADPSSDPAYSAALKIIDQMIEDSKVNGATNTLQTMNLINLGLSDVQSQAYQTYRTALTAAATAVIAREPSIAAVVNAILATAANPPAEPDFTDTTAPNAVTNLTAVPAAETATTSSVTLAWTAATTTGTNQVAGYDVYRDGIKIASVTATGYVDRPLAPSTTYTYFIVAFDAASNRSAASAEVTATTPAAPNLNVTVDGQLSSGILALPQNDIAAPSAPTGLSASPSALDAQFSSVLLSWSASTDNTAVTGYEVYRDGNKIATVSQPAYTDPSVLSNITYVYFVTALDAAGNRSAASSQLAVTPPPASLGVNVGGQVQPF